MKNPDECSIADKLSYSYLISKQRLLRENHYERGARRAPVAFYCKILIYCLFQVRPLTELFIDMLYTLPEIYYVNYVTQMQVLAATE